jgi:hypothetical protein
MGATHNVVIVGSGPAGCTAANRNCAGGPRTGANRLAHCGVLMQTTGAENFPGFVDGIDGPDLMSDLCKRAKRFGTAMITADEPEIPALGTRVGRVGAHRVSSARAPITGRLRAPLVKPLDRGCVTGCRGMATRVAGSAGSGRAGTAGMSAWRHRGNNARLVTGWWCARPGRAGGAEGARVTE